MLFCCASLISLNKFLFIFLIFKNQIFFFPSFYYYSVVVILIPAVQLLQIECEQQNVQCHQSIDLVCSVIK